MSDLRHSLCTGTRREFLWDAGAGFAGLALIDQLSQDGFFSRRALGETAGVRSATEPLAPLEPHFPAKAKRCIFLFLYGGPSQMDLFDYKPELQKRDGETIDIEIRRRSVQKQKLLASKRKATRKPQFRWIAPPNLPKRLVTTSKSARGRHCARFC